MKQITIAIDGHSSCGKSTMAKALAKRLGYVYVDTGAMYRAATLFAMRHGGLSPDNIGQVQIDFRLGPDGQPQTYLCGQCVERDIRTMEVSARVSEIAAMPFVREKMVEQQRRMGQGGAVVMDGRDIGTTVFPNAELKVFVTADAKVRAQRRYDELQAKGMPADFDDILRNVQERDYIDSHREVSPLTKAPDALTLDNSHMTIAQQDQWLIDRVRERTE